MKHIVQIIPTLDRLGGAERQVIAIACGLAARGWRVTVLALSGDGGPSAHELQTSGVAFLSLGMRKGLLDWRGWWSAIRWFQRESPAIVHGHLAHGAFFARIMRLFAPIPVVVDTLHSSAVGPWRRRWAYRLTDHWSDCVTAVSASVRDNHMAAGMVCDAKLRVVPNGVDVEWIQPSADMRATWRTLLGVDQQFVWLAVGRLEPVKDYPTLLDALSQISSRAVLVVAGTGAEHPHLAERAEALGISARVRWLGWTADLQPWLHAADCVVLSSLWEGLPMTLLEAAAAGLPVVATDVPGVRDVVLAGETGYLVPAHNPAALSQTMCQIMHMPDEERAAIGVHARLWVEARFSLRTVLDQWELCYAQLLDQPGNRC